MLRHDLSLRENMGTETAVISNCLLFDDPPPEWPSVLERAPAVPHFSEAWIRFRRSQGWKDSRVLMLADDARPVAAGVVYVKSSRWKPWKRKQARVDLLPVMVEGGAADVHGVAREMVELARRQRWSSLEVDSFGGPSPPPRLAELGLETRHRFEFVVDVARETGELWSGLKQSHRRKVRKAEAEGVRVAEETSLAAAVILEALQESTKERRAERGEEMQLMDSAGLHSMMQHLVQGEAARMMVARADGEPVSTMLLLQNGDAAYYLMGGTNEHGLHTNAASLLFFSTLVHLKERGFRTLNLGGVPQGAQNETSAANGLYRFKDGWAAVRRECQSGVWTATASASGARTRSPV